MIVLLLAVLTAAGPDSLASPAAADSIPPVTRVVADSLRGASRPASDSVALVLPEVRVERERTLTGARARLPTAFVSEIAAHRSNRALESLSEVLNQAAGVHIEQYGGLGAFSTISLRGAPPGQVSVYLDGAPLTSAAHGVVNLADLPAGAIDHVEVYRGMAPLGLGPATPGGAINLVSAPATPLRELRLAHGSFDTWEGRASAGAASRTLAGALHAGFLSSAGDFDYLDDHGTPFNPNDDRVVPRQNNRFDASNALGTASWTPRPGLNVTAREDFFHKAQGLPGLSSSPALNTRLVFERSITQLEAARTSGAAASADPATIGARLVPDLRFDASLDRERNRFRDDGGPYGLGELGLVRHNSDDHIGSERLTFESSWPRLPAGFSFAASASAGSDHANLSDPEDGYPDPPPSRRDARGAALSIDWRGAGEHLLLHAARRWDRLEDHLRATGVAGTPFVSDVTRELDSPQLGARLGLWRGLELRANWARAERAPDFLELFGDQGSITGNPALRPETGENRDIGAAWSAGGAGREAAIEWAYFESRASDLILYWSNGPNTTRADNVTSANIHGEEFSARWQPRAQVALSGSTTWQSAIDTGPYAAWHGKRLPQRPGRQAYARADLGPGSWRVSSDIQYMADDYRDRYNSPRYRIPSRTLVGASVSMAWRRTARVVLEGKNLGDRRVADVGGYPLPGRSLFVSLEVNLLPPGRAPGIDVVAPARPATP
jgi:iron complex outermembrane receptor protein